MVGGDAALAVGRSAHRQRDAIAEDELLGFDRVAGGVDVRVGRALEVVDDDVAAWAEREARVARDLGVGLDAHREHDEVGLQHLARLEMAFKRIGRRHEALDAIAERKADFVMAQLALEQHRHLGVELRQHLILQFDELDREALALQLLGHFQPDEAGADRHGAHAGFGGGGDAVHVFERA